MVKRERDRQTDRHSLETCGKERQTDRQRERFVVKRDRQTDRQRAVKAD